MMTRPSDFGSRTAEQAASQARLKTRFTNPALTCVSDDAALSKLPALERESLLEIWRDPSYLPNETGSAVR